MIVSDDIMKIVDKKENEKYNFRRCLDAKICPNCGHMLCYDSNSSVEEYICRACTFKYMR